VWCGCVVPSGPSGRLADKFKGLGPDGLVSPGTILNNGDVTINMQVGGTSWRWAGAVFLLLVDVSLCERLASLLPNESLVGSLTGEGACVISNL